MKTTLIVEPVTQCTKESKRTDNNKTATREALEGNPLEVFAPLNLAAGELERCVMEASAFYCEKAFTRLSDVIESSKEMGKWVCRKIGTRKREVFLLISLDTRHRVIRNDILFYGTVDFTFIHPGEIVKTALSCNAAAAVIAHNHPSGLLEPSKADKEMTKVIKTALKTVEVKLLDHFVVAGFRYFSFAEKSLL